MTSERRVARGVGLLSPSAPIRIAAHMCLPSGTQVTRVLVDRVPVYTQYAYLAAWAAGGRAATESAQSRRGARCRAVPRREVNASRNFCTWSIGTIAPHTVHVKNKATTGPAPRRRAECAVFP